jgi:ABC-2 type transport system permease protein
MNKTLLIIKREYLSRVRKRSFILMSILGPLIMATVGITAIYLSLDEPENQHILVIDENYPLFENLDGGDLVKFDVQDISVDYAFAALKSGEYTGLLHINKKYYTNHSGSFYFKKQPSFRVQRKIEQIVQQRGEILKLGEFNISESDYKRIKTPFEMATFKFDSISNDAQETDITPGLVGFGFSILIYMFIFMYSVQVMRGVIEEKSNRVIEVIISSVKPFQLMTGKIIGIAAVGLTQFLLWTILTFTLVGGAQYALLSSKYSGNDVSRQMNMTTELKQSMAAETPEALTSMSDQNNLFTQLKRVNFPLMLGMFLFYFLGGYLLYSAMMAAVGSAVDNDTDTQQFILPITFPLLLSYVASFVIFSNPNSPIAVWMSIIPFTSPVTMMVRIAFGIESGDMWQVWLSMFLLVATFITMIWIASKVYRTGILMYGKKASFKEMIKWLKY